MTQTMTSRWRRGQSRQPAPEAEASRVLCGDACGRQHSLQLRIAADAVDVFATCELKTDVHLMVQTTLNTCWSAHVRMTFAAQ